MNNTFTCKEDDDSAYRKRSEDQTEALKFAMLICINGDQTEANLLSKTRSEMYKHLWVAHLERT
ncbi:hypothetical protein TanjilG_19438 [Lupinus angustifolius]|uniref:Uncharacterized protein n=1 Tax=Lupinus angustifolius TaxID=3871 RepID=A0A4P1R4F7_LUPAN|nr:hypothetical protein TanjilG_19438 [Lupinus angustifolius]